MDQNSLSSAIQLIVREELDLDVEDINMHSSMETIEDWDSLGHLRICLRVEREFRTKFNMSDIQNSRSITAIVEIVERKENAR